MSLSEQSFSPNQKKFSVLALLVLLISVPFGIYLSQQVQQSRSRAAEQPSISPGQKDERFGLATPDCSLTKELGVDWFYHWGHGNGRYANADEETCLASGVNIFYTLGKFDNQEYFINGRRDMDPNLDFPEEYKNEFLKDAVDRANYQNLKKFLNTWFDEPRRNDGNLSKDSALDSFLRISDYTRKNPGAVYAMGNEPDWGPWMSPDEYAEMYHIYYTQVKKYDPTAKMMVKGLTTVQQEHVDAICSDPTKTSFYSSYGCQNGRGVVNEWTRQFRERYKTRYGNYPVVDIWGIHPYTPVWKFNEDRDNGWNHAKDQIIGFRQFLNSIGEGSTPVWLLEFGVQGNHGHLIDANDPQHKIKEAEIVADKYMKPLLEWLKSTNYAQKWFWYSAYRDENSDFLSDISPVNKLSTVYKEQMTNPPFTPVPTTSSAPGRIIGVILQNFGGSGSGDQNGDQKINELDFGAVYSK